MNLVCLLLFVYLAAVVETAMAAHWEVGGAAPDLLAIVAFAWFTAAPNGRRLLPTALAGLASDLGSIAPPGLGLATYAAIGYGVARLKTTIFVDRMAVRLGIIWLAATAATMTQMLGVYLEGTFVFEWPNAIARGGMAGIYTAAVALPVLMVSGWLRRRPADPLAEFA